MTACRRCRGQGLLQLAGFPEGVMAACDECGGSRVYRPGCRWPVTDCRCELPEGVAGTKAMHAFHAGLRAGLAQR
jgi:hypothetical protein